MSRNGGAATRPPLVLRCAALAAVAALAVGCGGNEAAERDVRKTLNTYFGALSDRDFATACAQVSPSFEETLARFAERSFPDLATTECEPIATRIAEVNGDRLVGLQDRVRVRSVEVDGDRATAGLGPGQSARLARDDEDWLIDELDFSGATGTTNG